MIIIGAGYSGLLAGIVNHSAVVYEAMSADDCAKKHQAVFRMRSNKIGEFLGVEFKKVKVFKSIWYGEKEVQPSPRIIHMYSKKVSDKISNRSISNVGSETRYIPPKEFWQILEDKCQNVVFDAKVEEIGTPVNPTISTVPLSTLLRQKNIQSTKFGSLHFKYNTIFVTKIKLFNCDSYATVYYPDPELKVYRSTINGNELIIESIHPMKVDDEEFSTIFNSLGLDDHDLYDKYQLAFNHKQPYGKITEIDNKIRSNLILDLTLSHNIYSLGRYATWRPKVMLDDVFDDIFVIRRLIEQGKYSSKLYSQND